MQLFVTSEVYGQSSKALFTLRFIEEALKHSGLIPLYCKLIGPNNDYFCSIWIEKYQNTKRLNQTFQSNKHQHMMFFRRFQLDWQTALQLGAAMELNKLSWIINTVANECWVATGMYCIAICSDPQGTRSDQQNVTQLKRNFSGYP